MLYPVFISLSLNIYLTLNQYSTEKDAAAHQQAMDIVAYGQYEAMAVSPLASGRLDPPDICLIYATPAQMILLINGLQWTGYKKLEWAVLANLLALTPGVEH